MLFAELHLVNDYLKFDLVHRFPLSWEFYKSHRSHVEYTCNLKNQAVLLTIVAKQPILLDYHGFVICFDLKVLKSFSWKINDGSRYNGYRSLWHIRTR